MVRPVEGGKFRFAPQLSRLLNSWNLEMIFNGLLASYKVSRNLANRITFDANCLKSMQASNTFSVKRYASFGAGSGEFCLYKHASEAVICTTLPIARFSGTFKRR